MKILITGANGQLGYELQHSCPPQHELILTDIDNLDITNPASIEQVLQQYQPHIIINGAAYTAVDKAESEPELADKINHLAVQYLAEAAKKRAIKLIQISTDFIFDGTQALPYAVDAKAHPLSVYGATKWRGEEAVRNTLADYLIIRTSWLYSAHGHNFVKTMLKLMATKDRLNVIYDQIGTPTWAHTLASTIWTAIDQKATGTLHCSDQGVASWYDFAVAIQEEALSLGLLDKTIPIGSIRTVSYPTPATRPAFSLMDKALTESTLGITLPYWRNSLRNMLLQYRATLGMNA
ncbi:dTDP-4-dehydrorhamnose reductase [Thiofilum flexile]|uniref:dTDP-4-dehydrorhamnose reductase n=1 Tax=Thiofilum flexile TaxID=125627 RepID=UPI0003787715|nr:dTDP-4-dehydrorhamnose reductase [Thiofilum flexile]